MTMKSEHENIIVGGGMLGMTLALRLAQRGERVVLVEAADRLGGMADAWSLGDVCWDRHYHVILLSDSHLRGVLKELQLDDEIQWKQTRTGFLVDGRLHSLSNSWEFLTFPPLSLFSKLRLAFTIFYASKIRDGRPLEGILVEDWLRKWSGHTTFERIWKPLLLAKLGENYRQSSASFIWATIQRMYAARRTGLKREMFGYVRGGYARIIERFQSQLEQLGVEIRLQSPVERIEQSSVGLQTTLCSGEALVSRRVIVTSPAPAAAKLLTDLPTSEREPLANIEYQGIICASALLKQALSPYYVTNITDEVPFTAVIEMTALVDPAELSGHHLVYLPKYVSQRSPEWHESDEAIQSRFIAALDRIYPHFEPSDVLAFRVSRVRNVMPLPTLNYSARLPRRETSTPGLYVVNSAHIVNGTLNVNETVKLAEETVALLPVIPTKNRPRELHVAHAR